MKAKSIFFAISVFSLGLASCKDTSPTPQSTNQTEIQYENQVIDTPDPIKKPAKPLEI